MECKCVYNKNSACEIGLIYQYDYPDCEYNPNKHSLEYFNTNLQNFLIFYQKRTFDIESVLKSDWDDRQKRIEMLKTHFHYHSEISKMKIFLNE